MTRREEKLAAFERLLTIMDELREQCPWDRKQTLDSLRNLTIEETYELADAILDQDLDGVKEEIGDLMLHMIFYAKIGEEKGAFDIADALNAEAEKLIHRHPHIYGDVEVADEAEVKLNWERLKLKEGKKSVLSGVPKAMPAMVKAYRMQQKAAQVGFDWDNETQVWDKVNEELAEYKEAADLNTSQAEQEAEFGDLLFSLINFARFKGIDPETALERTNRKFRERVTYIEQQGDKPMQDMTLEEMEALWQAAK